MRYLANCFVIGALLGGLTACGGGDAAVTQQDRLLIWAHEGKQVEVQVLREQVAAFRQLHPAADIQLQFIPEADYHAQVQAAAIAGKLPDLLDLDGPYAANYAWKGWLQPLEERLPRELAERLLPSMRAQGRWRQSFWCVGPFDSGLGLYVNTARLPAGSELPMTPADAWQAGAFTALLEQLATAERAAGEDGAVLDLRLNDRGEWWPYAFAPVIWSAGARLVGDDGRASGVLDAPAAVDAMQEVQAWIGDGLVDANTAGRAFVEGRVAFSWSGHWDYPRYAEALGDDLALMPLPDFGAGSVTGQGSWAWAITAAAADPDLAAAFIAFQLQDEPVLAMTAANGAVPATTTAVATSSLYGPDGPLALFAQQLAERARPRPVTPAYPVITDAFQEACAALRSGADMHAALQRAAARIDRDHADQRGYP